LLLLIFSAFGLWASFIFGTFPHWVTWLQIPIIGACTMLTIAGSIKHRRT